MFLLAELFGSVGFLKGLAELSWLYLQLDHVLQDFARVGIDHILTFFQQKLLLYRHLTCVQNPLRLTNHLGFF